MTYAQCRDAALKLINRYSIGGTAIATTYNGQADYIARIPDLINDAMMQIASDVWPIVSTFNPTFVTLYDNLCYFDLPDDAIKLYDIININCNDIAESVTDYLYVTDKRIAIKYGDYPRAIYSYCRTPVLLSSPTDTTTLDIDALNALAIPYFVAAHIIMQDDIQQYAYLLNEYETRLRRKPVTANVSVPDVYGASNIYGVY
jgi:hypothetical protein